MFDFWFEYKRAVPKGGVRLMGAIAEFTDAGLPIHFHVGNHDMWTFGYLEEELGGARPPRAHCSIGTALTCAWWARRWVGPWRQGTVVSSACSPPPYAKRLPDAPPRHGHLSRPNVVGAKPIQGEQPDDRLSITSSTVCPTMAVCRNKTRARGRVHFWPPPPSPRCVPLEGHHAPTSTQATGWTLSHELRGHSGHSKWPSRTPRHKKGFPRLTQKKGPRWVPFQLCFVGR